MHCHGCAWSRTAASSAFVRRTSWRSLLSSAAFNSSGDSADGIHTSTSFSSPPRASRPSAASSGSSFGHLASIQTSLLSHHWDTTPPSPLDLAHANTFFRRAPPKPLYVASALYQVPRSSLPEVAFLGRSNVGKSTLLNALLGASICRTSSKPGRTRALHAYAVGGKNDRTGAEGLITVLDLPGYGHGSQAAWEVAVGRYLAQRKELRRVFVLVDAMHGIKTTDREMLSHLRAKGIPHQVVLSKVDRVLFPQGGTAKSLRREQLEEGRQRLVNIVEDVKRICENEGRQGVPALGEVLCVSAEMGRFKGLAKDVGGTLGVPALRWSILRATGFEMFGRKSSRIKEPGVVIDADR